jgi:hypothetical protein
LEGFKNLHYPAINARPNIGAVYCRKVVEVAEDKLYFVIDNILQNFKAKKAYAS